MARLLKLILGAALLVVIGCGGLLLLIGSMATPQPGNVAQRHQADAPRERPSPARPKPEREPHGAPVAADPGPAEPDAPRRAVDPPRAKPATPRPSAEAARLVAMLAGQREAWLVEARGLRGQIMANRPADMRQQLAELERAVTAVEHGERYPWPALQSPVQPGAIGTLPTVEVLQVLDSSQMLATCPELTGPDVTLWITGVDTTSIADDMRVRLGGPFRMAGTRSYTALLGQRTARQIDAYHPPADLAYHWRAHCQSLAHATAERLAERQERTRGGPLFQPRAWTKADGAALGEAVFQSLSAGVVRLLSSQGVELELPLADLAESDQAFIRSGGKD